MSIMEWKIIEHRKRHSSMHCILETCNCKFQNMDHGYIFITYAWNHAPIILAYLKLHKQISFSRVWELHRTLAIIKQSSNRRGRGTLIKPSKCTNSLKSTSIHLANEIKTGYECSKTTYWLEETNIPFLSNMLNHAPNAQILHKGSPHVCRSSALGSKMECTWLTQIR